MKNLPWLCLLSIFCLACLPLSLQAKGLKNEKLNEQAQRLQQAYQNLQMKRAKPSAQLRYLDAFPKRARLFNTLFNPKNKKQLFDGNQYIFELEHLVSSQQKAVMQLLLSLAAELKPGSDAANYLQLVMVKISLNYSTVFAQQFKPLSDSKRRAIAKFMADDRRGIVPGYRTLISLMERTNQTEIASQLYSALN